MLGDKLSKPNEPKKKKCAPEGSSYVTGKEGRRADHRQPKFSWMRRQSELLGDCLIWHSNCFSSPTFLHYHSPYVMLSCTQQSHVKQELLPSCIFFPVSAIPGNLRQAWLRGLVNLL